MNPFTETLPYFNPLFGVDRNRFSIITQHLSTISQCCINHISLAPHRLPACHVRIVFMNLCCRGFQILPCFNIICINSCILKCLDIVIHDLRSSICRKCKQLSICVISLIPENLQIIIFIKITVCIYIRLNVCNQILLRKISCFIHIQKCNIRSFISGNSCLQLFICLVIICLRHGINMILSL